jgi:hypothetical protein
MKKQYLLLGALKLCLFVLGSCSTGDSLIPAFMTGGSSQALTFVNCRTISENEIEFNFSRPVTVRHLRFNPEASIESIENGSSVRVKLEGNLEAGRLITVDLLAEDEKRNSINVLLTFRARNNRMPNLIINEINTEFSNPRTEFIEFKMESAGNLGAMRVVMIGNTNATRYTVYEFSPVEVKKDEFVVLHLRTIEDSKRNEYGSNLSESGGANSSPTARDFWIPGSTKLIHKTSIIYVLDQDDNILTAVMLSETPTLPWPREHLENAANLLLDNGAWFGSAIPTAGSTATRTICRDETVPNTNSAADWYITATRGATPGGPNNPSRF